MRWVIGAAIVVGLAFGLTQAIIPNRAEQDGEDRLTRDGGGAAVTVKAIPAIRLLVDDGDVLDVDARRINIPIEDLRGGSFKELDGFDEVKVQLVRSDVGPFAAE